MNSSHFDLSGRTTVNSSCDSPELQDDRLARACAIFSKIESFRGLCHVQYLFYGCDGDDSSLLSCSGLLFDAVKNGLVPSWCLKGRVVSTSCVKALMDDTGSVLHHKHCKVNYRALPPSRTHTSCFTSTELHPSENTLSIGEIGN